MSDGNGKEAREAILGNETPTTNVAEAIGKAAKRLDEIAVEMAKAKTEDTTRFEELRTEQQAQAKTLADLKASKDAADREAEVQGAIDAAKEWREYAETVRTPSKAHLVAGGGSGIVAARPAKGDFLWSVYQAAGRDAEHQAEGKATLQRLAAGAKAFDAKGYTYEESWGKATLGATAATGGWIIPNAIVDEFIVPAQVDNIYRGLCTSVSGVTAASVDIPYRDAARSAATVIAFGETKENLNLAYQGYTATMYTIARIYDIGNQFLRQSRGAAEADVLSELAAAFAAGESNYIRSGTGSSQPYGYTPALTNGPAAYTSAFTASATTLAGSIAKSLATAAGALAGRGVNNGPGTNAVSAVLSASSYWTMISQGTNEAGFFFNPASGPTAIAAPPGTLVSPFGIPVYPDAAADLEGTAATIDNLVVGQWKKLKVYFGESYRVDSSDQAGSRWDTNLTGFRGEEELGFDARPAVYAGYFQLVADVVP